MDRKREQTLIRAAQRGDRNAFAELYRTHVDRIYRYIYYRVESQATAEDLTGEVFLRMLESLPGYQDRSVPLLVWLYRIAHARVIDHYRRSKRSSKNEPIDDLDLHTDDDMDAPMLANFKSEQLHKAMQTLTDGQRQVIILRFIEGHNLERTAQLLAKTVDAVKAMQYRALQALGQALQKMGYKSEE